MTDRKPDSKTNLSEKHGCAGFLGSILGVISHFYHQLIKILAGLNYEYESDRKLFGLPLISVKLGLNTNDNSMRHARGIIAIGTKATGLFSFGLIYSRGLVAIGAVSFGLVTVSMVSIALVSVSVFGLGFVSVSVFAFGYLAIGVLAIGYKSIGIIAIGKEVVGIICYGQKVNSLFSFH